jgi:hypothetical protein
MVVADLHVHTTNSDGEMELAEVPEAAKAAGVSTVCITDHDRINPQLSTPVTHVDGVTLIHGIELRVDAGAFNIDLLGYGLSPTDALEAEIERLQTNRVERASEIVDRLEDRLGVMLDVDLSAGVGRPHIARATAAATDYDYGEVFEELIGDDGPCYVARDVTDFGTGVDLLTDACGLVGLAHPFRYPDPKAALELCATDGVGAVERWYPYGRDVDTTLVDRASERHGLVLTGGSDAHDHTLGRAGLDAAAYRRFRGEVRLNP